MQINPMCEEFKGEYKNLVTTTHTTSVEGAWEVAASFTISKPCIVKATANFMNDIPQGVAISVNTSITGATSDRIADGNLQSLSTTELLTAGTYNVLTKYNSTTVNSLTVDTYQIG